MKKFLKLKMQKLKIKNYLSYNDTIPNDLKSFLVCTYTCASCSSSYIGKTCHHFKTRIEEHIKKENKSHIFKHLHSSETCFDSYNSLCFKIIDKVNSKFDLKIKVLTNLRNLTNLRYADDILAAFDNEQDSLNLIRLTLNST